MTRPIIEFVSSDKRHFPNVTLEVINGDGCPPPLNSDSDSMTSSGHGSASAEVIAWGRSASCGQWAHFVDFPSKLKLNFSAHTLLFEGRA